MYYREDGPRYEIKIGTSDNTKSSIARYEGDELIDSHENDSPGVLHCEQTRTFYLTWDSGYVKVGNIFIIHKT